MRWLRVHGVGVGMLGGPVKANETWIDRSVRAGVQATSEVYFPENDFGAPDWRDTEMVERTMQYIISLPPNSRTLLRFLFVAVEWLAPFLLAGLGRFSKRSLPFRLRAVRRWNTWNFILFRFLADGLKAQLTMTYVSHPLVQEALGVWKSCEREADPYRFPTRPDYLASYAQADAQARGLQP